MYARAAIWTALRYLWATDALEQGVPIYFLIGEDRADETHAILNLAGIPQSLRVISPQQDVLHFAVKWSGIFDSKLDTYDMVVVADIDSYPFFRNHKYELFKELLQLETNAKCVYSPDSYKSECRPPAWAAEHMREYLGTDVPFWDQVEQLYPDQNIQQKMQDPEHLVPAIGGWFVGFTKQLRQDVAFREMFFSLARFSSLEVMILEIYLLATGSELRNYAPQTVWKYENLQDKSMLSHIYTTDGFEWEQFWHDDCVAALSWALHDRKKAEQICQR